MNTAVTRFVFISRKAFFETFNRQVIRAQTVQDYLDPLALYSTKPDTQPMVNDGAKSSQYDIDGGSGDIVDSVEGEDVTGDVVGHDKVGRDKITNKLDMSTTGTIPVNHSGSRTWEEFCGVIHENLPWKAELGLVLSPISIGSAIFIDGFYFQIVVSSYVTFIPLIVIAALLIAVPLGYISTLKATKCPKCDSLSTLKTDDDVDYEVTAADLVVVTKTRSCSECDYTTEDPERVTKGEFRERYRT